MKPRKLQSIQVYRAVALVMVYLFHQMLVDEAWSRLGVCMFFIITGFVTAYRDYDGPLTETEDLRGCILYGIRRIRPIYLLHVIMLLIACPAYVYSIWDSFNMDIMRNSVTTVIRLILNLLLISDWIPHISVLSAVTGEYNIPIWFLSACLLFYIVTPPVFKLLHRIWDTDSVMSSIRRVLVTMGGIYAVVVISNLITMTFQDRAYVFWHIYESPLSRFGDYLIGCGLGVIYRRFKPKRETSPSHEKSGVWWTLTAVSVLITGLMMYGALRLIPEDLKLIVSSGFYFTIPVCGLIMGGAMTERGRQATDETDGPVQILLRILLWLAAISPYAYLIQVPVINLVHGIYKRLGDVNIWIWSAISVIITLVASELYRRIIADRYKHTAPSDR